MRTTSIDEPDAVVAGYTDWSDAIVRLLTRVAPDTYVVSYETPASTDLFGLTCSISGSDIDGNGQPDVLLDLSFGKGRIGSISAGHG